MQIVSVCLSGMAPGVSVLDIHTPKRIHPNDVSLTLPWDWHFGFLMKHLDNCWMNCHVIWCRYSWYPEFSEPLTFLQALPASQSFHSSSEITQHLQDGLEQNFVWTFVPVPGLWYWACWLSDFAYWDTCWNGAIIYVIIYTCAQRCNSSKHHSA